MCEAVVYLRSNEVEEEVMREVMFLEAQSDRVLISDLMGNQKELRARVKNVDFWQHKVLVEEIGASPPL